MKKGILGVIVVAVIAVIAIGAYVVTLSPTTATPTTTTTTTTSTTQTTQTSEMELKVASIYIDPTVTAVGWDLWQHKAMLKMQEQLGFEYEYSEGVATTDSETVGRSYADRGFNVIMYTSWFPDGFRAVADAYPEIYVFGSGGGMELNTVWPPPSQVPANVGHFDDYIQEATYLMGYLSGKITESNFIGMVCAFQMADVNREVNGFIQGAKDANPDVQIRISWMNTWYDPAASKEATLAFIEQGADVIYSHEVGAEAACKEQGVPFMASQWEESIFAELAPEAMCGIEWVLDPFYEEAFNSILNGTFESKEYYYSMPEGGARFNLLHPEEVPSDVVDMVSSLEERIMNRTLKIDSNIGDPVTYWGLT